MIRGYCRTNLDDYGREEWPNVFVAIPNIGDRVESKNGKWLYVCGVVHKKKWADKDHWGSELQDNEPYIEVELHNLQSVPRR